MRNTSRRRTRAADDIDPRGVMRWMIDVDPDRWAAAMRPERALSSLDHARLACRRQRQRLAPKARRARQRLLGAARSWKLAGSSAKRALSA